MQIEPHNGYFPSPRRRGRPRKQEPAAPLDKVGYDPHPTVIDDPPECDESIAPAKSTQRRSSRLPKRAKFGVGVLCRKLARNSYRVILQQN